MDSNVSVSKFFSINELKNAVVVDSEGFIYGKVMEYYLTDGKLFLKAYIEIKAKEKIVNVDRIISELEEKGVNIPSDAPLELIVTRAKEEGLDIYYKLAEKPYTLLKGLLPIDEIRWIDSTTLEKEIEEKITSLGGTMKGSITKDTDYLICDDQSGVKYEKAIKLDISVFTYGEYIKVI